MILTYLTNLSIAAWWPVRTVLVAVTVLVVVAAARWARSVAAVLASCVLVLALLVANVGAAVNAHYDYLPTLGLLWAGTDTEAQRTALADRARGHVPRHGEVVAITIGAPASRFPARQAQVYLPPAWFEPSHPRLPVLVLMHGTPGSPTDWLDGGQAQATLDRFAAAHRGRSPIVVMPDINGLVDADTECVDSPAGRAETYLTDDLPTAVTRQLSTTAPGRGWAVAGLSEGGMCATMLALRHPTLFGTWANFAGLLGPRSGDTNDGVPATVATYFGGSEQRFAAHEPADLLRRHRYPDTGGWFEVGNADPAPAQAAALLAPLADAAGIDTCRVVVDGGHTFDVWSQALRDSLPWIAARTGVVDPVPTPPCPQ